MDEIPAWSGRFVQLEHGICVMCLSVCDERSIETPTGFVLVATFETEGGEATAYMYVIEEAMVANF